MTATMTLDRDLLYSLDPARWAFDVLGFVPDDWQRRALRSGARRALWLCARQTGKSHTAAALAVHQAVYAPGSLVLLISPSLRQSQELFRRVTDLLRRLPHPPALPEDNRLSLTTATGSRIVSLPSTEATVRGFSAPALIIEDESARVRDSLHEAIRPMQATNPDGRLILLSTPWGKRGHFFQLWTNGGPEWERVCVPADACDRIAPSFLESERASLPRHVYQSEYECVFVETEDNVFSYDEIQAVLSDDEYEPITGMYGVAV
jgi:hypothetical protein